MKTAMLIVCLATAVPVPALARDGMFCDMSRDYRAHAVQSQAESDADRIASKLGQNGGEIQRELAESAKWLKLAANHGDPDAIFMLGHNYESGVGLPQNYAEAEFWMLLAYQNQDGMSEGMAKDSIARQLKEIEKHLTPGQIAAAHARAQAWRPAPLPPHGDEYFP
jgi:TPR repeat protein